MVKVGVSLLGSTRERERREGMGAPFSNGGVWFEAEAVDISFLCLYFTFPCLNLSRFVLSLNSDVYLFIYLFFFP